MKILMISRADAIGKLASDCELSRARNYELEEMLSDMFGGSWCISEWCPFNGRFCTLMDFAPKPWPFMNGEPKIGYGGKPKVDCSDDWKLPTTEELQEIADNICNAKEK